jgi:hypothetical protein
MHMIELQGTKTISPYGFEVSAECPECGQRHSSHFAEDSKNTWYQVACCIEPPFRWCANEDCERWKITDTDNDICACGESLGPIQSEVRHQVKVSIPKDCEE